MKNTDEMSRSHQRNVAGALPDNTQQYKSLYLYNNYILVGLGMIWVNPYIAEVYAALLCPVSSWAPLAQ